MTRCGRHLTCCAHQRLSTACNPQTVQRSRYESDATYDHANPMGVVAIPVTVCCIFDMRLPTKQSVTSVGRDDHSGAPEQHTLRYAQFVFAVTVAIERWWCLVRPSLLQSVLIIAQSQRPSLYACACHRGDNPILLQETEKRSVDTL